MNNLQEIQLNVGLNYTDENGKQGEFDRELGRHIIESMFTGCGMVSEPYQSEWTCLKTGVTYLDNCLAYKITTRDNLNVFTINAIRLKVADICRLLRQDSVAFCVSNREDDSHSELFYADPLSENKLEFNPRYFHYIA